MAIHQRIAKNLLLCPGLDSNQHVLSNTTTSKWLVYQFQHPGNGAANVKCLSDLIKFFFLEYKCRLIINYKYDRFQLFLQNYSESCSFPRFRMFYIQLPFVVLFHNAFTQR